MQGTIVQIITLVLHGNAFFQTGELDSGFYPDNSAFKFCEYVKFVQPRKSGNREKESLYANDPKAWLVKLKQGEIYSLRLIYTSLEDKHLSDRMSVGFIGVSGRWLIEAVHPSGADYWEARWEVGNQDHPEQRIWQVAYGLTAKTNSAPLLKMRDPALVKQELLTTLNEMERFANRHKLDGFAEAFRQGRDTLTSLSPYSNVYHKDISPDNFLPLEARQLLAASQAAWVFGGMGSWNDMGFDDKEHAVYESLSDRLYKLLNEAYLVAVNSSSADAGKFASIPDHKPWWAFWQ